MANPNWQQLENQAIMAVFVAVFLALAVWESRQPAHNLRLPTERRWLNHGGLLIASALLQSLLIRVTPIGVAISFRDASWGLLNQSLLPPVLLAGAALLLLDLVHYLTHRLFHTIPFLWRVHEVHHSDPDFDVSVAARFHPLEVVTTKAAQILAIILLCPPPAAVLAVELISTFLNLFTHANIALPPALHRLLSLVFVTPALHRVHHSADAADYNCNFGQSFIWWDNLAGTYRANSGHPIPSFPTGVHSNVARAHATLAGMLLAPFRPLSNRSQRTADYSGEPLSKRRRL